MSYQERTVSILGGGQLGRMLIQAGTDFNINFRILDPDKNAPCRATAPEFVCGSLTDFDTVYHFGKGADIITIEIENVNTHALKALEKEGINVFPQPHIIELIQDKRLQKQFYDKHHIPTAPFVLTENKSEITHYLDWLPAVHKCGKGGYDGKGVQIINSMTDIEKAFDVPSVLEKKIAIQKEISVIVARNQKGEISTFPAVECVYHTTHNLVDYLLAPAQISEEIEQQARHLAVTIIKKLGLIGILAVEMFVDDNQHILVNEIAPRPHNSGHQSIEGNYTSQYAQHLRAILNLPLGNTDLRCHSAMLNLLGDPGHEGYAIYEGMENILTLDKVYVHLYGKKQTKPFRKMGHITILGENKTELLDKINYIKQYFRVISYS